MAVLEITGDIGRSGDWSGLVVFFGGTAWDGNRFPDQHIAERLTRWAPVLYVDPPLSALRAVRAGGARALRPRLTRLDERLLRLTPVAPPAPQRKGVRHVTNELVRRTARAAVRRLGTTTDVVVVASLSPWLDAVPARIRILYGTDDFVAGAELMGVGVDWLRRREQEQLRQADLAIAVSEELARSWRTQGARVDVVENGCDVELFAGTDGAVLPTDVVLTPPIAGFIGHLSNRIDLALLEAVADDGHSVLLVGPRQSTFAPDRIAGLLARPNVQWTGPRPFEALPGYLRLMDVGLVPYADTAFNRASFPLKTLEYLAAGRPAVVTGLPAMHRLPADAVSMADTPACFARAVAAALSALPDETAATRRRAVAAEHGWDARAADFARLLGLTLPDLSG
jgi:teichuronic acid biosynthesis glycosyltransferase TuaH